MSIVPNYDDPLLVKAFINNKEVHWLLVDIGSSTDIMFYDFFKNPIVKFPSLQRGPHRFLQSLYNLNRICKFNVTFGKATTTRTTIARFIVVQLQSSYNAILGRPISNTLRAMISIIHLAMKFLINDMQVITLKGDQKKAREFFKKSLKRKDTKKPQKKWIMSPGPKFNLR